MSKRVLRPNKARKHRESSRRRCGFTNCFLPLQSNNTEGIDANAEFASDNNLGKALLCTLDSFQGCLHSSATRRELL